MYTSNGNGYRHQSTSYRGNGQSRFEQDCRPANQTAVFDRMDNRLESRRYQRNQGCERSRSDSRSRQETEYKYRGDYERRHQSDRQEYRSNSKHRNQQQSYGYTHCASMQQKNRFQTRECFEQKENWTMKAASLPDSPADSDSQSDDGSSTKSLGKAFSFEEMLKSVEEFRKLDWSEEVEKEHAQQQLEKKRAEFFAKAAFIMQPRTENPVWEIKKRTNLKPIVYREKTYYNYIHYG
uniref:Arginine/serine-rich coiled-coil protein 2 n=1 Tax=Caenorhabditis tropicalis TaxID=1561998 RepID=A0A1I7URS7_9PELO